MYTKISFWSINHTQQEQNDLKYKFDDRYLKYKSRLSYEQNLQYWIMKYEDLDNNKDIAYYFEDLSIEIHNDYTSESKSFYTKSEQFHIFFDQLEGSGSITVVNTLADNTFKH